MHRGKIWGAVELDLAELWSGRCRRRQCKVGGGRRWQPSGGGGRRGAALGVGGTNICTALGVLGVELPPAGTQWLTELTSGGRQAGPSVLTALESNEFDMLTVWTGGRSLQVNHLVMACVPPPAWPHVPAQHSAVSGQVAPPKEGGEGVQGGHQGQQQSCCAQRVS